MPDWKCEIEKVNNGYIMTTYVPEEDDKYTVQKDVFSMECLEDTADVTAFVQLVWFLAEYYGVLGSKHDEKRFWVGVRDQSGTPIEGD